MNDSTHQAAASAAHPVVGATKAQSQPTTSPDYSNVAVLLPCYNEEVTVAKVVQDFRDALPGARIYVFDNNSRDRSAELAAAAGAEVIASPRQGKGNVVRHMFDVVDADWYLMADADDTYPASAAPDLLAMARQTGADMVVGTRLEVFETDSFRRFHRLGNHLITGLISRIFQTRVTDVLSGYRVFSHDFVRTIPLLSQGFEIETELTLQAAAKQFNIRETPITYGERPEGSESKLNTYGDGFLILKMIFLICRDYKPLTFFGSVGIIFAVASLLAGLGPIIDYIGTGEVPRFPSAILAASLGVIAVICVGIGLMLHTIRNYHNENFEVFRKLSRPLRARGTQVASIRDGSNPAP